MVHSTLNLLFQKWENWNITFSRARIPNQTNAILFIENLQFSYLLHSFCKLPTCKFLYFSKKCLKIANLLTQNCAFNRRATTAGSFAHSINCAKWHTRKCLTCSNLFLERLFLSCTLPTSGALCACACRPASSRFPYYGPSLSIFAVHCQATHSLLRSFKTVVNKVLAPSLSAF